MLKMLMIGAIVPPRESSCTFEMSTLKLSQIFVNATVPSSMSTRAKVLFAASGRADVPRVVTIARFDVGYFSVDYRTSGRV